MKKIAYLTMVLCGVTLLAVRSDAKQPSNASNSPSSGDMTFQGCMARSTGYYILMSTDPANTYNLEEGSRKIKLGPYLGEQVEVTGWESPQLSNSSSPFYRTPPSAVTITVRSIKAIGRRCTEGEVGTGGDPGLLSGAELELSSILEHTNFAVAPGNTTPLRAEP